MVAGAISPIGHLAALPAEEALDIAIATATTQKNNMAVFLAMETTKSKKAAISKYALVFL